MYRIQISLIFITLSTLCLFVCSLSFAQVKVYHSLEEALVNPTNVYILDLSGRQLTELPFKIGQLTNLHTLNLSFNDLSTIPSELGQLRSLHTLDLSGNNLTTLPPELGQLTNLHTLDLPGNNLTTLPPELGQLTNLHTLNLSGNNRITFPPLSYASLTTLPPELGQLTNLHTLDLSGNNRITFPPELGQLTNLHTLNLSYANLTTLPPELGQLTHLHTLDLSWNILTTFPPELGQLTNLHTLDLSGNHLTTFPPELGQLTNLHTLDLSGNDLIGLPPELSQLTNLHILDLWGNDLIGLPSELGQLTNLHTLDLWGNDLTTLLPELTNLQLLGFPGISLTTPPEQLKQFMNLKQFPKMNQYIQLKRLQYSIYRHWFEETGISKVLDLKGMSWNIDRGKFRYILDTEAAKNNNNEWWFEEWNQFTKQFHDSNDIGLQEKLLFKFSHLLGVPVDNVSIVMYIDSCDIRKITKIQDRIINANTIACISQSKGTSFPVTMTFADALFINTEEIIHFLKSYYSSKGCDLKVIAKEENYMELLVEGLRAEVIKSKKVWENLQISVFFTEKDSRITLRVILDGQFAAGLGGAPAREAFIDMEPRYSKDLQIYTNELLVRLQNHLTQGGEKNERNNRSPTQK